MTFVALLRAESHFGRKEKAVFRRFLMAAPFALVAVAAALIQGARLVPNAAAQAPIPTITQITPTYSAAAGGANVTISGTNFNTTPGGTQFTDQGENPLFGSVKCASSTQCTATSLPMQVDQQSAFAEQVFATVGEEMSNTGLPFVWYGRPALTRLTPASARAGTVVTLHGGVFPSAAPYGGPVSILFGDKPAVGVACPNVDECYGQAPPGSGTVQVTITTPGGTSNSLPFTYAAAGVGSPRPPGSPNIPGLPDLPAFPTFPELPHIPGFPGFPPLLGAPTSPSVSGITPNYGPAAGGTLVTITGAGFDTTPGSTQFAAAQYQFTAVSCAGATTCTAVAPAVSVPAGGVLFGDAIRVTVGGQSAQNQQLFFAWYGTPQLTGIQPSSGPPAGGTVVTLTGGVFPNIGGYPGPVAVQFGPNAATHITCHAGGSICTAMAPPGSGTVEVTVTTPGGTSNAQPFTYSAAGTGTTPAPGPFPIPGFPTLPFPLPTRLFSLTLSADLAGSAGGQL